MYYSNLHITLLVYSHLNDIILAMTATPSPSPDEGMVYSYIASLLIYCPPISL